MAEDFAGVLKQELHNEDFKALANQTREHESVMRLKRRWLMDLPLSDKEEKMIAELLPPNDKAMPESFIREDDVGCEEIRTCIEKAFGASTSRNEANCVREDLTVFDSSGGFQQVLFLLDGMTNNGLCSFARILSGGLDDFDKTKRGMMRTIRELLPKVIAEKNDVSSEKLKKCSLLLKDPTNFRGHQTVPMTASESYHAAALKVLEGLENFSSRTLRAMRRKLNGEKGYDPPLQPPQYKQSQLSLVNVVRRRCMKKLSKIRGGREPAKELAGALGVAGLTLKLMMNRSDVMDFREFSPEMGALHNEIAKAIHLLDDTKKVNLMELRKVQHLFDPNAELSTRSLRQAVRNLLIEYLYECSDMDSVPECLIEALDIINRRVTQLGPRRKSSVKSLSSAKLSRKEEIEKEVQHVLNVSAQAKELVANLLPEHEFDEEFARAYLEVYDGSDDLCVFDDGGDDDDDDDNNDDDDDDDDSQHFTFHSYRKYDETEGTGETNHGEQLTPVRTSQRKGTLPLSPNGKSDDLKSSNLNNSDSNESRGSLHSPSKRRREEFKPAYSDPVKVTTKPSMLSPSHSHAGKSSHKENKVEETTSCSPAEAKNVSSGVKVEETDTVHEQRRSVNGYLKLQEACDATSMVAYHFVGSMLDSLAKAEGLELHEDDRLYLHSHTSVPEDSEGISGTVVSKFSEMWKNVKH